MRKRDNRLTTDQIAAFGAYLRTEERERSTIKKYLRNVRVFAAWLDGAPVTKSAVIAWKEGRMGLNLRAHRAPCPIYASGR